MEDIYKIGKGEDVSWKKYQESLEALMVMSEAEQKYDVREERVNLPPSNEIGLQFGLIDPDQDSTDIINKNMRIGNFTAKDHAKVNMGGFLITYLEGLIQCKKLEYDKNLHILRTEIIKDVNIVQLSSVSRSGTLIDGILNPKKTFRMLPDRGDKKKLEQTRETS